MLKPQRLWRLLVPAIFAAISFGVAGEAARAEHHENWVEIKSPHYTVYSNCGEHDGRRVALQFEEIRALFEQSFKQLRVDFGKPTIVYVLRDENSLKLLMPSYGQNKNAMKIAGWYQPSFDKNFAIVRADVTGSGANAYHVMYHEWAHGLFRLNFRGLPTWLDEGLAEYWGSSDIENKQATIGVADARQLRILQQNQFLPISTLVSIDRTSPLYNTQEHAGVFYAESWAIVHYFSMAPEVRDQKLLNKYLAALQETDDPIESANRSFGDLKKLGEKLERYARQPAFYSQKIVLHSELSEKDFGARKLSPAEGLVVQADYLVHSNHLPEAIEALHEAEKLDGNAARLHDELGYYHYLKADYDNCGKEFDLALAQDPNDTTAFMYKAYMILRKSNYGPETTPQIIGNLERVISLQPNYAAAHAFLSIAYGKLPETKAKAFAEAKRAMDLEPGNFAYFIDVGKALLANGDLQNAQKIAERADKLAMQPSDRNLATGFRKMLNNKLNPAAAERTNPSSSEVSEKIGQITELLCGHPPSVMFTLKAGDEQLLLHIKDIARVEGLGPANASNSNDATRCASWKDRKAKVTFTPTPDGPAAGEVKSMQLE